MASRKGQMAGSAKVLRNPDPATRDGMPGMPCGMPTNLLLIRAMERTRLNRLWWSWLFVVGLAFASLPTPAGAVVGPITARRASAVMPRGQAAGAPAPAADGPPAKVMAPAPAPLVLAVSVPSPIIRVPSLPTPRPVGPAVRAARGPRAPPPMFPSP
jgi:hypothetical protein